MATSVFPAASSGKSEQTVIINSTQTWTAPAGVTIANILLVAGGGGGGYNTLSGIVCGGGGGGGVVQGDFAVSPGTSYTVTIGAGGGTSGNGSDSTVSLLNITARGGGYGASGEGRGGAGGCGGGSTSRFGDANYIASKRGGGGGGAGEVTNLSSTFNTGIGYQGGHGHNALNSADSVAVAGGAAYLGRFGGGGGGCTSAQFNPVDVTSNLGWGGGWPMSGGYGGHASNQTGAVFSGGNGVVNSGGGGGGGGQTPYGYAGAGSGGSGVCIIKYWA